MLFVVPLALLIMFVYDPNRPVYLYSALPPRLKESLVVLIGFGLFETLIVFLNFAASSASFVYWCAAVFQNIIWLDSLIM